MVTNAVAPHKVMWNDLGEMVHVLRRRKGLSQAQLAGCVKISPSYLSEIERNVANPTLSTLQAILEALGYAITIEFKERTTEGCAGAPCGGECGKAAVQ